MTTRTATVRDLRNNYTTLLAWLEAGENILITRRGKLLARLTPEKKEPLQKKIDWTKSAALTRDHSGEQILNAQEIATLLHESQGDW